LLTVELFMLKLGWARNVFDALVALRCSGHFGHQQVRFLLHCHVHRSICGPLTAGRFGHQQRGGVEWRASIRCAPGELEAQA